jgi:putative membrane protein
MNAFMGTFATMPDATFLLTAASSNLLELQAGQMAAQKATSASVKKFAQMMVDHHTKATQQLQTIAKPLGVVPSQALMPIHQAMLDQLTTKSAGKQFDEAYMDAMETAHTMDIAMFEVKSKGAETPTVQTFATKTLPMLRSHRTMAGELEKKVD